MLYIFRRSALQISKKTFYTRHDFFSNHTKYFLIFSKQLIVIFLKNKSMFFLIKIQAIL